MDASFYNYKPAQVIQQGRQPQDDRSSWNGARPNGLGVDIESQVPTKPVMKLGSLKDPAWNKKIGDLLRTRVKSMAQDIDGQQVTTSPSSPMPAYTTDDYTIPHYSYAARNASPGIRRAKEGGKQRDLQL